MLKLAVLIVGVGLIIWAGLPRWICLWTGHVYKFVYIIGRYKCERCGRIK